MKTYRPSRIKPTPHMDELITELRGPQTKRININLPIDKAKAFKAKAAQNNTTMTSLIERWIEDYLG